MERKKLVILGATGSIGSQTLDVAREFPDRYEVVGLSANRDLQGLLRAAAPFPGARLALASAPPAEASFTGAAGIRQARRCFRMAPVASA